MLINFLNRYLIFQVKRLLSLIYVVNKIESAYYPSKQLNSLKYNNPIFNSLGNFLIIISGNKGVLKCLFCTIPNTQIVIGKFLYEIDSQTLWNK